MLRKSYQGSDAYYELTAMKAFWSNFLFRVSYTITNRYYYPLLSYAPVSALRCWHSVLILPHFWGISISFASWGQFLIGFCNFELFSPSRLIHWWAMTIGGCCVWGHQSAASGECPESEVRLWWRIFPIDLCSLLCWSCLHWCIRPSAGPHLRFCHRQLISSLKFLSIFLFISQALS